MRIGVVYHLSYLKHNEGVKHPERSARLKALLEALEETGLKEELTWMRPEPAGEDVLCLVHTREYVGWLEEFCRGGGGYVDVDTPVGENTFRIACLAVGGVVRGVEAVVGGEVERCFCAVRPPGHHAEKDKAMGFCYFNNVAIGAKYALENLGVRRIFIVDWDAHHGNGTQNAFYDTDKVFYFSIHQYPFYPGTGAEYERGEGAGEGFTLNVPVPAGTGDEEYIRVFEDVVVPAIRDYKPELIMISCGFDPYVNDHLTHLRLTERAFYEMTRMVCELADEACSGRVVSVFEGGYSIAGIKKCGIAHIRALGGREDEGNT